MAACRHHINREIQLFGQFLPEKWSPAPAADTEDRSGRTVVILFNYCGNFRGDLINYRFCYFYNVLGRKIEAVSQDIFKRDAALALCALKLYPLCRIKIQKEGFSDLFRYFIPGHGDHGITNYCSLMGNGYIRGSGSDIYQGEVEGAVFRWDGYINSRNRFQGKIADTQPQFLDDSKQAVNYYLREKGD